MMSSSSSSSSSSKTLTVTSSTQGGGSFTVTFDGSSCDVSGGSGMGLCIFDSKDWKCSTKKTFDSSQISSLCSTIQGCKDGSLIVMGFKGDCTSSKFLTEELKSCLSMLGSREITRVESRDCWAMMTRKGMPQTFYEMRKPDMVTFTKTMDCSSC